MGKKVLICIPNLGVCNGVTTFIMTFYDYLLQHGYEIDFLLVMDNHCERESYVSERGSRIFKVPMYKKYDRRRIDYIDNVFREGNYDIVHVNFPGPNGAMVLKMAKKNGVKCRIYHCHNPLNNLSLKSMISEHVFTPVCIKRANKYVACSDMAGRSVFGNRTFEVINNAIDPTEFRFDSEGRKRIRESLNIEDKLVIGVAARITEQKNPLFLLEVFKEIRKRKEDAVLLWVGDGNMTEQVRRMCSEYQMEDAVLLPGRQTDVVAWYSAMDLFLLPSKFEGLGIVYLEAQANGLHCFGSDCVPEETQVTNRMHRISLKHNASRWADEITAILDANHTSRAADDIELFQKANYDSRFVAGRLYEIYESFCGNKAE